MKFLFETTVFVGNKPVKYRIYLHTNGSFYAESMNPDFDNFMLKNDDDGWLTSLSRNQEAAQQIGEQIAGHKNDLSSL